MAKGFSRSYSNGRASGEDEGDATYAIAHDPENNLLLFKFFKPMKWLGFDASALEQLLITLAKHLSTMKGAPVTVSIGDADSYKREFGERLFSIRDQRGWSQERLAEVTGITTDQVEAMESGEGIPDAQTLLRVADELGASIEYLLTGAVE